MCDCFNECRCARPAPIVPVKIERFTFTDAAQNVAIVLRMAPAPMSTDSAQFARESFAGIVGYVARLESALDKVHDMGVNGWDFV